MKTNNQIIHEDILNKANKEFIAKKKKKKIFKNISSNIKEKDETIKNKEAKKNIIIMMKNIVLNMIIIKNIIS